MRGKRYALGMMFVAGVLPHVGFSQGSLAPPGAPAESMKSLDQVEARVPISSAPFSISVPGSYYLTTNLTGTATDAGISIKASGVTLDLNGFELVGVPGSLDGIDVPTDQRNIEIRNGTVRNWGQHGVNASRADNSMIIRLRVLTNGWGGVALDGITIGENSIVRTCVAESNRGDGVVAGKGATVSNCAVSDNIGNGIFADDGSVVSDCAARGNDKTGILAGESGNVHGCTATFNGDDGIRADFGSTVRGCTLGDNSGDGVEVAGACHVAGNTCERSGLPSAISAGIHVTDSRSRIDGNVVVYNGIGIKVDGIESLITRNTVITTSSNVNYEVVANNKVGVIVTPPDSVAISGTTGGAGVGTTNPWANFSY